MRLSILAALVLGAFAAPLLQEEDEPRPVPAVGAPAPAIRLNDHDGNAVAVGGEAERWTALAFYPRAKTPG